MSQRVVDVLELVEIDIEQRTVRLVARHTGDGALQFLLEIIPVEQAGQRIVFGVVGKLVLEGLLFRDIARRAADLDNPAIGVLV